jgi:c-di-GMP-binding flagellar brake protein YcgR
MEIHRYPDLERRNFPRLKDNIFIFGNLMSTPSKGFKAFTKDIGAGGLMFETERYISLSDKFELEIYLPLNRSKCMILSLPVLAKALWRKKIKKEKFEEGENKYVVGIEFLEIKEEDSGKIAKYVEEDVLTK